MAGKTLWEMRWIARLSQTEIAAMADISEVAWNKIEGGLRRPQFRTIRRIEKVLADLGQDPKELDWERTFQEGRGPDARRRRSGVVPAA